MIRRATSDYHEEKWGGKNEISNAENKVVKIGAPVNAKIVGLEISIYDLGV